MNLDQVRIKNAIQKAIIAEDAEDEFSDKVIRDVAFHMTDWLDELVRYYEFCKAPEKFSTKEINKLLIGFLVHVPNHVAAASKLFNGIPVTDVFKVDATSGDDGEDE